MPHIRFMFNFRTTVSVIVISSLFLYQVLVAQDEEKNHNKQEQQKQEQMSEHQEQIQRLEQRVKDLEEQLLSQQNNPKTNSIPQQKSIMQHPIDVAFLNYKDRKRILITGGAGFVGSHLTDKLMLAGHEVIVADNMFTGN